MSPQRTPEQGPCARDASGTLGGIGAQIALRLLDQRQQVAQQPLHPWGLFRVPGGVDLADAAAGWSGANC